MSTCQTCFRAGQPVKRVVHDDDPWCQDCIDTMNKVMGAFSTIVALGPYVPEERARRPVLLRGAGAALRNTQGAKRMARVG